MKKDLARADIRSSFLSCEKESSYITAQGIVIDGGSTLPETMTMGV